METIRILLITTVIMIFTSVTIAVITVVEKNSKKAKTEKVIKSKK